MYELKKIGKVFTSKFVRTGPSSCEKRIYRAAVSQSLTNTALDNASTLFNAAVSTAEIMCCQQINVGESHYQGFCRNDM